MSESGGWLRRLWSALACIPIFEASRSSGSRDCFEMPLSYLALGWLLKWQDRSGRKWGSAVGSAPFFLRCESTLGGGKVAQVFGFHHPNIATKKQPTKAVIWRTIVIQYRTGAVSL
jgi:hypothetical protein